MERRAVRGRDRRYCGVSGVPRGSFIGSCLRPTPERRIEAYYLQRPRFESIAERKLRPAGVGEDGVPRSRLRFAKSLVGDRAGECLKSTQTGHSGRTTASGAIAPTPAVRRTLGTGSVGWIPALRRVAPLAAIPRAAVGRQAATQRRPVLEPNVRAGIE
jgi:hypothetical protein